MTTITAPRTAPALARRTRLWFGADAVVTATNALAYLVLAGPLADLLGGEAGAYRELGLFMVGYAVVVGLYARSRMPSGAGWAIVAGNAVWVLASLEIAVTGAFGLETAGRVWAVAQALVVADLALLQARSLRAR
jgi:hypothetical protein